MPQQQMPQQQMPQYQNPRAQPAHHPSHGTSYHNHSTQDPTEVDIDDDEATVLETLQYINSSSGKIGQRPQSIHEIDDVYDPNNQQRSFQQMHEGGAINELNKKPLEVPSPTLDVKPGKSVVGSGISNGNMILLTLLIGGMLFTITSIIPVSSISRALKSIRLGTGFASEYIDVLIRTIMFMFAFFIALKSIPFYIW